MKLQDYSPKKNAIQDVELIDLPYNFDDSGEFCEVIRLEDSFNSRLEKDFSELQINISTIEPKAVKAFHLHLNQTDYWVLMPGNKAIVNLIDIRDCHKDLEDEPMDFQWKVLKQCPSMRIVMGVKPQMLVIPKGVLHGISNPSPTNKITMMYLVDKFFDGRDEWRIHWDVLGRHIWETING